MEPLTAAQLRDSFINCSKGERSKIAVPADVSFDGLDFLGWRDAKAPDRAYLVTWADGRPVGIAMRAASKGTRSLTRSTMCSMCLTAHTSSGVTLFTAPLRGESGRNGNTVGNYMCANLQCSRYVRGELKSDAIVPVVETVDLDTRVERLRTRVSAFVAKVSAG